MQSTLFHLSSAIFASQDQHEASDTFELTTGDKILKLVIFKYT